MEDERQVRAEIERLEADAARLGAELSALSAAQALAEAEVIQATEECAGVDAARSRLEADNTELERVIVRMGEVAGSIQLWNQPPLKRPGADNGTLLRLLNWLLRSVR